MTDKFAIKPDNKPLKIFTPKRRIKLVQPLQNTKDFKSFIGDDNSAVFALKWTNWAIESASTQRTIKTKNLVFDPNDLIQPVDNPNKLNKRAWSQFYRAMNCMRNDITRESKAEVSPVQFHSKQQEKLRGMIEPDGEIVKAYIDEISKDAKLTKNSLFTNFREVTKVVNNLNPSAAYDSYDISTKQLKLLCKSKNFINMIIEMWNNIVVNGRIAQSLKWDNIIYLWKKKGVKSDPKFYRPITLVTAISKILEGLLQLKIKQELPCPADIIQHAYKPSRSIQTALLDLDEKLSNSNRKSAAVMFLDLKGAFESVDHTSLTYYINKFSPVLSKIVKSYLTNKIATIYNANYPDEKPKLEYMRNRSVPQGSKVSPLLFSIATGLALKWIKNRLLHYQNSLKSDLNIIAYADDVAIAINADSPDSLPNTITTVSRLFKRIMKIFVGDLEPSKTEILISETTAYSFNKAMVQGAEIKPSTMIKWLGYHIKLNQNSTLKTVIPQSKK